MFAKYAGCVNVLRSGKKTTHGIIPSPFYPVYVVVIQVLIRVRVTM